MAEGTVAADQLRLFIERVERLEEEKKNIAEDIRGVYAELKSQGYDAKTVREIVKLRKMEPHARREREALLDTYKAALGMLDGTPLGNWAIERLTASKPKVEDPDQEPQATPPQQEEPEQPEVTLEDARRLGGEAARAGQPVTSNPFPARDVRRAAWDEAWCHELGSDGMDIPDALKPSPKPKKVDSPDEPKAPKE